MRIQLQCVVQDGSTPASTIAKQKLPTEQRIEVPKGERLEVQLVCVRQNGTAFDLANSSLMFTVRRRLEDAEPMFARLAENDTPSTAGLAVVEVDGDDTLGLQVKTSYIYDVQLTDANDERWQVVPASHFYVKPVVGLEGELPADPLIDEGAPIAIGPRGYSVLPTTGVPDPDYGRNGDWAIDDDDPEHPIWRKIDDVWVEQFDLRGPPGPGAVLSDANPEPVGSTSSPGVSAEGARIDHIHPHGDQAGGSLHGLAVAGVSHGFMSATMASQLAGLVAADFGAQIASVSATVGALSTTVAGLSAVYVPQSRQVIASGGLTGGGALTSDVTLSLDDQAALSVLGVTGGSAAAPAPIVAGTNGHVLRRTSATDLSFGTLVAGSFADNTISGARLAGFTVNAFPIGVTGGGLGNSTVRMVNNYLEHAVSSSGAQVTIGVDNTSNTASSRAKLYVNVGGATADDPMLHWSIGSAAVASYIAGIDNSHSDAWTLVSGTGITHNAFGLRFDGAAFAMGPVQADAAIASLYLSTSTSAGEKAGLRLRHAGGALGDNIALEFVAAGGVLSVPGKIVVTAPGASSQVMEFWTVKTNVQVKAFQFDQDKLATFYGNVAVDRAQGAGDVSLLASNTEAAATANTATIEARVTSTSTGNPRFVLGVTGGTSWTTQVNNSTSDRYELLSGSTVKLFYATGLVIGTNPTAAGFSGLEVHSTGSANQTAVYASGGSTAGNIASFQAYNSGSDRRITASVHGASAAGDSNFGTTNASHALVIVNGSAAAGHLKFGTVPAIDIIVGTNNVERARFTGVASATYGSGVGTWWMANATTNPSAAPSSGYVEYADAGAAKSLGSDGTTTTLATYSASHVASRSAGDVGFLVSNTNTTATANTATIEARVTSTSTGNPKFVLGITGGTSWSVEVDNASSDVLKTFRGSTMITTVNQDGLGVFTTPRSGYSLDLRGAAGTSVVGGVIGVGSTAQARWTLSMSSGISVELTSHGNTVAGTLAGINKAKMFSMVDTSTPAVDNMILGTTQTGHVHLVAGDASRVLARTNGNIAFNPTITSGADATDYGGGVKVLSLGTATTEPASAPTTGNVLLWFNGTDFKAWKAGAGAPVVLH